MLNLTVIEAKGDNIAREIAKKVDSCNVKKPEGILITDSIDFDLQADVKQDILVISGSLSKRELHKKGNAKCVVLLTPGSEIGNMIHADCVVSYGMSGRDTITLSSIGEKECVLALQRELITVDGRIIDRQELPVRRIGGMTPDNLLAVMGALLLLGINIE